MTQRGLIRFLRTLAATLAAGLVLWLLTKLGVNVIVPTPHP